MEDIATFFGSMLNCARGITFLCGTTLINQSVRSKRQNIAKAGLSKMAARRDAAFALDQERQKDTEMIACFSRFNSDIVL
mmetsp:Transcript_4440/g.5900  ORF Transcript_4440/g.5900 Transcript_4440/m.5900 type:complete len:80 (-) Transcript_4440:150-389(-)